MREESKKIREEVKGEISQLRQDLRVLLETRLEGIESKVVRIEAALRKAGIM